MNLIAKNEPVLVLGLVVGVLTALIAGISVAATGGTALVAILAGLNALLASLGGAAGVRQVVTPTAKSQRADVPR